MKDVINRAIKAAGGMAAFVRAVGAPSAKAVAAWKLTRVPAEYCPRIELATGILCEELRPDIDWAVLRRCPSTGTAVTNEQVEAA